METHDPENSVHGEQFSEKSENQNSTNNSEGVDKTNEKVDEGVENTTPADSPAEESVSAETDYPPTEPTPEKNDPSSPGHRKEEVNYALLNKTDLLEMLRELLDSGKVYEIGKDVAAIKSSFYRQLNQENEEKKKRFLSDGGLEKDFSPGISEQELELKAFLDKYSGMRAEYNKLREEEKDENLKKKLAIIEEIRQLVHRDESINKTFHEFRELQNKWHETGLVPQGEVKNLWDSYHYHVEKFYDYIKINKELRDLDLKKNLEAKIGLCEKAEELLLDPNIINAFKILQKYHDQWREIGPVPKENRTEIWDRFKEATSKINKKHQQHYHDLKEGQKKNLESKTVLCEKAEAIADLDLKNHQEWVEKTREILEIQKIWKTIGFAPKKDNNKIYSRFRSACDKFFNQKRDFYAQGMEEQEENYQKKMDLCVQAEALRNSTDWKKTTDELIRLQKDWKKIGPVPRKKSDAVWKRFRAACDDFFNRKSDHFSNIDGTYASNLKEKEALIEEIKEFSPGESMKENLNQMNEFQRRWADIGFVPFEKKDEITQIYRDTVNAKYDELQLDENKKSLLKFRNKLDAIVSKPRPDNKLRFEREKLVTKLQQLKSDIVVWENNIGFFAESKKADNMIRDFHKKIENARQMIELLEDKISLIDDLD